jgi:hypothetical protein
MDHCCKIRLDLPWGASQVVGFWTWLALAMDEGEQEQRGGAVAEYTVIIPIGQVAGMKYYAIFAQAAKQDHAGQAR